jgi:Zn-dependent peptidase ImmA (M78 family)
MTSLELQKLTEAYAAVYNADLRESFLSIEKFKKIIKQFISYCKKELNLETIPEIHFLSNDRDSFKIKDVPGISIVDDPTFAQKAHTFGRTSSHNRIVVDMRNRHPMDALRTLAHELAHYHQHVSGVHGTGETGSSTENDANIQAGIIMRNFGDDHPDYFDLSPLK